MEKKDRILAIDPGDIYSGYVVVEHDGNEITAVLDKGKVPNKEIFGVIFNEGPFGKVHNIDLAVEMIASYGMAVGKSVFETCVYIGRFIEHAEFFDYGSPTLIYRKDEKMNLCGTMKAKDANIRQALIDRYAPNTPNGGKGSKKEPGFFYGFKADIWAAMAVAVTYFDLYVKGKDKEKGGAK